MYSILDHGSSKSKKTAVTLKRADAGRIHTVFTITVNIEVISASGDEVMKVGKLNLVWLAGSASSENISIWGYVYSALVGNL